MDIVTARALKLRPRSQRRQRHGDGSDLVRARNAAPRSGTCACQFVFVIEQAECRVDLEPWIVREHVAVALESAVPAPTAQDAAVAQTVVV